MTLPRPPGPRAAWPLLPLSWLFRGGVAARNLLYDTGWRRTHRLPVPVVSVGNLAVGGTGKTPLVAWLAQELARAGRRPAVVSRGYGGANERRAGKPPLLVSADPGAGRLPAPAAEAGDEAAMLAAALPGIPVVVCPQRAAGARLAVERCGADLILLDDGFQHRALAREADLVALDAHDPWAGGRLLPAGSLREPPVALRRAHAVVLTRADQEDAAVQAREEVGRVAPGLPVFRSRHLPSAVRWPARHGREAAPSTMAGVPVAAFAGLGRPESLQETLTRLGARVVAFTPRPDHAPYGPGEVGRLVRAGLDAGARWVITTAKDAARIPAGELPEELAILEIQLEVEEGGRLVRRVLDLCPPGLPAPPAGHVEAAG